MTVWNDSFPLRTDHLLELELEELSVNTADNTSSVRAILRIDPPGDSSSWSGISGDNSYFMRFNNEDFGTSSFTFDFRTDRSDKILRSVTRTITHGTSGAGTVEAYGWADTVVLGNADVGNNANKKSLTLKPLPGTPTAAPTLTRNDVGTTVTVLSATSGTTAEITDYEYQQSTDGSTWGTATSMGTDASIDVTGLTATQTYYYQTRVKTADGSGPWSATQNTLGAPATITATRTGRNVAVTAGNATGDTITGYFVQYSTNSGSSWSTAQAMTSQAYTYTNLTPGLTYLFRVYATSASGNSGKTVSAGVFVSAGGKRWDGSAWQYGATAKRWNGSAWVDLTTAKRWNGSAWTDLS